MATGTTTGATNHVWMAVPNRMREHREARGLSRRAVSIELGVTESTVERWETSKVQIPDERKLQLAELLEVPVSALMGWD